MNPDEHMVLREQVDDARQRLFADLHVLDLHLRGVARRAERAARASAYAGVGVLFASFAIGSAVWRARRARRPRQANAMARVNLGVLAFAAAYGATRALRPRRASMSHVGRIGASVRPVLSSGPVSVDALGGMSRAVEGYSSTVRELGPAHSGERIDHD